MTRAECIEAMARAIDPDAFRTPDGADPSEEHLAWLKSLREASIEEATAAYDAALPHIQAEQKADTARISALEAESARLQEVASKAIEEWESFAVTFFEGTSAFSPEMAKIDAARAALGDDHD